MKTEGNFYSDGDQWEEMRKVYESEAAYALQHALEQAYRIVCEAREIPIPPDMTVPDLEFDYGKIARMEELRKGLSDFCRDIQESVEEHIDDPFFYQMMKTMNRLYELNPGEITSPTGEENLAYMITEITVDKALQESLRAQLAEADTDSPDPDTKQAMIEAIDRYYEKTYGDWMLEAAELGETQFQEDLGFVIGLYEELYPEHAEVMNQFLKPLSSDKEKDYTRDIQNLKYIVYTADSPYQDVFFKYAGRVKIVEYEYDIEKTQHYNRGKLWLNFSGKNAGVNDPRGPYTTVFHEVGHAIDDMAEGDILFWKVYNSGSGKESIHTIAEQDLRRNLRADAREYVEGAGYTLTEEEIERVIDEFLRADSNPDRLKSFYMQDVYNQIMKAYGWNEIVRGEDGKHKYIPHGGTKYDLSGARQEALSDIIGGFTNNAIGGYGYGHRQEPDEIGKKRYTHWYDSFGNATKSQGKELWAQYFAACITGNEETAESIRDYFTKACEKMEEEMEMLAGK